MLQGGTVKMQVLAYCVTAVKCPGLKRAGIDGSYATSFILRLVRKPCKMARALGVQRCAGKYCAGCGHID